MDPVITPFVLLFLGTLGLDLGLFDKDDDDTPDAAPVAPSDDDTETVAEPGNFDASLYTRVVDGTSGDDTLSAEDETALAWFLGDGDDVLDGSDGSDYAEGGEGDDEMSLRDGRDLAYGGEGDDTIDAGIGFDTVFGGAGDDELTGNGGNDDLYGEEGNDILRGGSLADALYGGEGDDVLYGLSNTLSTATDANVIDGVDTLSGGEGNDRLVLGPGDIGIGGEGSDTFVLDHARPDITNVTQVTDYTAEDVLEIHYQPQMDRDGMEVPPEVSVVANAANSGAFVMFNGATIAEVIGGQDLTPDMIRLTPL